LVEKDTYGTSVKKVYAFNHNSVKSTGSEILEMHIKEVVKPPLVQGDRKTRYLSGVYVNAVWFAVYCSLKVNVDNAWVSGYIESEGETA